MRRVTGARTRRAVLAAVLGSSLGAMLVPGNLRAQQGLGFRFDLGYQELGGEWGDVLDGAMDADLALLYAMDGLRFGVGVNWASMGVTGTSDQSWHQLAGQLLVGYAHPLTSQLRPFGEVRYLRRTARPEGSRLFVDGPPTEHIGPFRASGNGVGTRLGVEVGMLEGSSLSLSVERQWFTTGPEPVEQGLGSVRRGTGWRLGAGLTWFPVTQTGESAHPAEQETNLGLAVGVGSLGLLLPWTWNEYIKGKPFTPVSPRSWRRGVTSGFAWDDNNFDVNYLRHPYQGQFYYNAARANGYGFGPSLLQTVLGSYLWECCTETHVPSFPDMVTTVVGGVALGESLFQVSSDILDPGAHGIERVLREVAAGLLNPAGGITRVATGRAWSSDPRPAEVIDAPGTFALHVGVRGASAPTFDGYRTRPFLGLAWSGGGTFQSGEGLFSDHRLFIGIHPGDRAAIGELGIRGSLWRGGIRGSASAPRRVSTYLDVDYVNTESYRLATQSMTGAWTLDHALSATSGVRLDLETSLVLMGSVDSEYARFAEIRGVRERARGYDFGAGGGARVTVSLRTDDEPRIRASYRFVGLRTLNGSNIEGRSSSHLVHIAELSARERFGTNWGVGVEAQLFAQDSRYGFADFVDTFTSETQARLYLSWQPARR